MAKKTSTLLYVVAGLVVLVVLWYSISPMASMMNTCPGSHIYCPGVGCVSGQDKCFPGAKGGASKVFSRETFVSKSCPDGTRTDGPCLLEF